MKCFIQQRRHLMFKVIILSNPPPLVYSPTQIIYKQNTCMYNKHKIKQLSFLDHNCLNYICFDCVNQLLIESIYKHEIVSLQLKVIIRSNRQKTLCNVNICVLILANLSNYIKCISIPPTVLCHLPSIYYMSFCLSFYVSLHPTIYLSRYPGL